MSAAPLRPESWRRERSRASATDHPHDRDAYGHGRIEGADGDVTHGKGAGKNGEANGKTIERVSRSVFSSGGIDDNEDQGEGKQEFGEQLRRGGQDVNQAAS